MESVDYSLMRRAMVDSQLRTSGVTTPWVIAAMGEVARETFVPAALRTTAYMDRALPLGGGRALNPPVATGLMLQAADVTGHDDVLLIGAGTGYVAELLAQRARRVVAVEGNADLVAQTHERSALNETVTWAGADLGAGSPADAPYSLIFIDGSIEEVPTAILAQATEGARVVTGLIDGAVTRLASGFVRSEQVSLRPFADTEIAALPGFATTKEFVF